MRLLTVGGPERARALLAPAFEVLAPHTLGRSAGFAFGAGDLADGLFDPETRKRLAEVRSRYDPASLFRHDQERF
ncbi:BBE domain-containing protein [Streptomyces sp. NPDC000345]|uniref:BBE domain-containing protein n=1 Tax=Streptomyces sp. NPDC000345 TaxID=3364537 RepID=UPI0036A3E85A